MNSWIGGSLSSLKGQLSHLITEGTEEISDSSSQVISARNKISELEKEINSADNEIANLKEINNELLMKLQSEELLLQSVSESYKEKLKEKEEIIENLTNKLSHTKCERRSGDNQELNNRLSISDDNYSNEYLDHSTFSNVDEINRLKSQVNLLNQELNKWKALSEKQPGSDQINSFDEAVKILLEEQQQDLELQHSNYIMELQQEHCKQIHFLNQKVQQFEQTINDNEYNTGFFQDDSVDTDRINIQKSVQDLSTQTNSSDQNDTIADSQWIQYLEIVSKNEITSILNMITDKIIHKEATVESIVQKINECNNQQSSKSSSDLISDCYPSHSECSTVHEKCRHSSGGISDNQQSLKISTQMKQAIADSMSQVSDISEVSIKSRILEEHVKILSNQLTDYEKQFIDIEEISKGFDNFNNVVVNVDDINKIGSRIQNLKAKLSERKCVTSKHAVLEYHDEERFSNVEDSWENSSNNSLVEEQHTGLHQEAVGIIDIMLQDKIIELYRLLFPDSSDNAINNVDMLQKIIKLVIGMVKMDASRLKLEQELLNMYNDIQCGNVVSQSHDTFTIIEALKDSFRSMRETCSVHDYILEENKSLQELVSKCQQKIENLDLEKSELNAKNTELDGQLIDMSITIARYEGLEKICDKYQKEMSAKSVPSTHKSNLSMDSDDILEHVETFNQEKDECIEALESKIISLQNLCEEKDDYINDLKQQEVNIIFEYDSLIEVLKGELDSVRGIVEKTNESELTYKKKQQELQDLVNEKETMIKSLNEELTMLSIIDIESEVVPPPSNKKYMDNSSQTTHGHDDNDGDNAEIVLKNDLEKQIEYLMIENHRLEKVLEAQASSLGQYEIKVTNLQVELTKLSRLPSNIDHETTLSAEEMTKETLHHLSQMIRDKEWEIEALQSKNSSLCEIIKTYNSSNSNEENTGSMNIDYIETVLNEKESLSKELSWYQENREQLISALNLKHKESLNYHGEIQRLISYINTEQEKWNEALLEIEQLKEQIKIVIMEKSLVNSNSEGIEKPIKLMVDTAVSFNSQSLLVHQSDDGDDDADIVALVPQECGHCKQLKEKCSNLDEENHKYSSELRSLEKQAKQTSFELEQAHLQITELSTSYDRVQQQLVFCQNELSNQYENITPNRTDDSTKNIWNTDYQEEVNQTTRVLDDKEQLRQQLHRMQIECDNFINQIEQLKGKEMKLLKEKQIFQDHLIRIEESYTQDATLAEDREQILRKQLHTTEDNLQSANDEILKLQNIVSNIRNELRIELNDVKKERDEAQRQLKEIQIQLTDHMKSLANLQSVLDRFQQEQTIELLYQKERYEQDLDKLTKDRNNWEHQCNVLQSNMDQQKDLVDAAQRLSDQIELKDDQLAELQALLAKKEEMLDSLKMEIRRLNTFTESKVDKILMKNLVIGYFHTPQHRRQEALKVIGSLLQFADTDYNQIGIDTANKSRWFSWLRPGSNEKSLGGQDSELTGKSFSELFITFLEKESTPMPQVKLPTNQIAAAARQHSSLSLSQEYPYAAHASTSALSSVIDHHKFFPSSPVITKRNGSPSNDQSQSIEDPEKQNASLLYIPNIKELNPDLNQNDYKTVSNHRRSESSRNALLSLLDQ